MDLELIIDQKLFSPIPSRQHFEADYEGAIFALREILFGAWRVAAFKHLVTSAHTPHGPKRADLALVNEEFTSWWVVEIELSHHSLENHVAPQVEVLALGDYSEHHARALADSLNLTSGETRLLERLMRNRQPRILVVVDDFVDAWSAILADFAEIMVVKPFVDRHGKRSYLVSGARPSMKTAYISVCIQEQSMPRSLIVQNPESLALANDSHVAIKIDGGWSRWKFIVLGPHSFLFAEGKYPLPNQREFVLGHDGSGDLFLQPMNSKIRRMMQ